MVTVLISIVTQSNIIHMSLRDQQISTALFQEPTPPECICKKKKKKKEIKKRERFKFKSQSISLFTKEDVLGNPLLSTIISYQCYSYNNSAFGAEYSALDHYKTDI